MTDEELLSSRLRERREYLGYSQQEVADYLDLHRPAISEIEAGRRKVDVLELKKLARLFETPVSCLLGGANVPPSQEVVDLVENLDEKDREEVLRFAEFLQWRKRR